MHYVLTHPEEHTSFESYLRGYVQDLVLNMIQLDSLYRGAQFITPLHFQAILNEKPISDDNSELNNWYLKISPRENSANSSLVEINFDSQNQTFIIQTNNYVIETKEHLVATAVASYFMDNIRYI